MSPLFRITVGSDPDHEDLVGELYFDDRIVCVVTQENGLDAAEIEFFPPPNGVKWTLSLHSFEDALAALRTRLWELRRAPEGGGDAAD